MDDHSSNALLWRVVEPDDPRSSAVYRFAESLNFQWNDQQWSMNEPSIRWVDLLTRQVKANEAKMVCTVQPKLSVSASLGHRITSVPLSPSGGASVVHTPKYSISFMTLAVWPILFWTKNCFWPMSSTRFELFIDQNWTNYINELNLYRILFEIISKKFQLLDDIFCPFEKKMSDVTIFTKCVQTLSTQIAVKDTLPGGMLFFLKKEIRA